MEAVLALVVAAAAHPSCPRRTPLFPTKQTRTSEQQPTKPLPTHQTPALPPSTCPPQVLVEKCLGRRICKKCVKNFNIAVIYLPASEDGRPEIVMPPLNPPPECKASGVGVCWLACAPIQLLWCAVMLVDKS